MTNLTDKIGFSALLEENGRLSFGAAVDVEKVSERKFSDLRPVAANQDVPLSDNSSYLMYRGVKKMADAEKISNSNLRFDLTVVPPAKIGDEYIKTIGHYHPNKQGTNFQYPELYYVASGVATCLVQNLENGIVTDVIICQVEEGNSIVIPPGYGHATINAGNRTLVMANWVCNGFDSDYSEFENKQGAAYYILDKFGEKKIVKNPRYGELLPVKNLKSAPKIIGPYLDNPAYDYVTDLSRVDFLRNPEKYLSDLSVANLFE
ncbi:MAG: glucose-6-phosphate isomerase family protein [Patescibacteria group bacterium]|jgi:glucose-6-phosphate isomerase